jgi:Tol biopolymer transport system component
VVDGALTRPKERQMKHPRITLISVLAVASAAAALAALAQATTPGANGLIAYSTEVRGHYQVFTIRPDGTGERQLTRGNRTAFFPDWSPDGNTIAFEHEQGTSGRIALMSFSGRSLHDLTARGPGVRSKGHVYDGQPSFTPDGRRIVFSHGQGPADHGIWIMRRDGSGARRLTRNPFVRNWDGGDIDPEVSPDGKFVSFIRIKKAEKLQALFIARIDGSGLKRLTPYALEVAIKHDWSPDGTLILLTTHADQPLPGQSANLAVIRADGSGLKSLTRFAGGKNHAYAGSFSPDGTKIVFRLETGSTYSLATVDREGANLRRLTTGKTKRVAIEWGSHR